MNTLRDLWKRLTPAERRSLRRVALSLLGTVALFAWRARMALAVGAAAGVTVAGLAGSGPIDTTKPAPIKREWIQNAAGYKVERVNVPCLGVSVDRSIPAKGVAHTTEGGWASAMSVFRRHYAPHFMVGRDGARVRIVQFCPLGSAGAALRNTAGGVETNRWARVQIELVGFSQRTLWRPDPGVLKAYAALLYELRDSAGIPLRYVANPSRSAVTWRNGSGWFGHAGVPENDHWDPGVMDWQALLKSAAAFAPVVHAGHEPVKPKPPARPPLYRVCYWKRELPNAVCHEVRYASLTPLKASKPQSAVMMVGGSVGPTNTPG